MVLLRAGNRRGMGTIVDTDAIRYKVYWRNGRGHTSTPIALGSTPSALMNAQCRCTEGLARNTRRIPGRTGYA